MLIGAIGLALLQKALAHGIVSRKSTREALGLEGEEYQMSYIPSLKSFKIGSWPVEEKKMEENYGFKVGDKIETSFGGKLTRGIITNLNPRDYPRDQVAVRFDDYAAYGSDTDFHGWPVKELTKVETAPVFKKGDRVYVNCLDEYSDENMQQLVDTWGEIQNPDYHPISGKDKDCATVHFGTSTYYFCKTSLLHEGDAKLETREFKTGDSVRVKCLDEKSVSSMRDLVGARGKVNRIDPDGHVHIEITSPRCAQCFFLPASLELVSEDAPSLSPKEKKAAFARAYGAAAAALRTTVSATIILASGREVCMPDPPLAAWEIFDQKKGGTQYRAKINDEGHTLHSGGASLGICHEEGRCWTKDMARIVNQTERVDHFTERYAYVTELRCFQERPPKDKEAYTNADSVLATLW